MSNKESSKKDYNIIDHEYDVVIVGAGIGGAWSQPLRCGFSGNA